MLSGTERKAKKGQALEMSAGPVTVSWRRRRRRCLRNLPLHNISCSNQGGVSAMLDNSVYSA